MLQRSQQHGLEQTGFPGVYESSGRVTVAQEGKTNTAMETKALNATTATTKKLHAYQVYTHEASSHKQKHLKLFFGNCCSPASQLGAITSFAVSKHQSGWLLSVFPEETATVQM